jgi:hypothetical protein
MEVFVDPYACESWCADPRPKPHLNELERAIYSTIAYRDVFDFAPEIDEIHRYLHWIKCGRNDVAQALARGPLVKEHLTTDGRFFALKGRERILGSRLERRALGEKHWPNALRYARFLANLPHVRMVGLTGTFAADNFAPGGDIDFILLTDAGAMWRARALARTAAFVSRKFGTGMLCPNTFLSLTTLALPRESLYDAHELAQIVPLFGHGAYEALRRANSWSETYLPNAQRAPETSRAFDRLSRPRLKSLVEWGSNSFAGRCAEELEALRNMRRFNRGTRFKGWTLTTRERHSFRESMKQDIEKAWRLRLEALEAGGG